MKKSDDPEKIILSEHDKFFKEALSDLRVARDFLQAYMPKDLLSITDIDHLVSQDKQFLNEVREDAEVDVLYKTTIGDKEAYIYLLLEHQSKVDRLMPFRMLKYSVAIISRHLQVHRTKKIPLVYPMVVYHGQRKWPWSTDIRDIVDAPPELVDQYFLKPFKLIDIGQIEDGELKRHAMAGAAEIMLKHIFDKDMLPAIREAADLMRRLVQQGASDYVAVVLQYTLSRGEISQEDEFFRIIRDQISPEIEDSVMTLAQKIEQKGRREALIATAISMLTDGADPQFVAKHTRLSLDEVQNLAKNKPVNDKKHQ